MIVNFPLSLFVMILVISVLYGFALGPTPFFGQTIKTIRERNVVVFQEDGEIVMCGSNKSAKRIKLIPLLKNGILLLLNI